MAFGLAPEDRRARVAMLLEQSRRGSAGYWLQIAVATGIATLGLALDSTAVVIGAMLVSPLMAPIVELGMGLAVGSPLLVLRSFARASKSVLLIVFSAALATVALPFHEVTHEISARVSPTALDLLVAVFCAIAAAYAHVRAGSDATVTAAGTAIGIALVPPVCVVGYGIGTRSPSIATGAALLFTANFCAIMLFAVVCFLVVGFNRVDAPALEAAEHAAQPTGIATHIAARTGKLFASRYGVGFRVAMPFVLVAAVYVPLRRALQEVAWEVRVRAAVEKMIDALPQQTVNTTLVVKQHGVTLRLITVGSTEGAASLRADLERRIESIAGVDPKISVVAVADSARLRQAAAEDVRTTPPARQDATELRGATANLLASAWPRDSAGELLAWRLSVASNDVPSVEIVHIGAPLGRSGETLLAHALSGALGAMPAITDVALSPTPIVADARDGERWLPAALESAAEAATHQSVRACVVAPSASEVSDGVTFDGGAPDASATDATTRDAANLDAASSGAMPVLSALRATRAFTAGRLQIRAGERWEISFAAGACPSVVRVMPPDAATGD